MLAPRAVLATDFTVPESPFAQNRGGLQISRIERTSGEGRDLIVESEAQIRKLIQMILVRAGYQVFTAHNPQAAIEMCNSKVGFDLVLSSISLPVMDGHDLARWIARHFPNSRVILMSAVDSVCEGCPFAAAVG